MKDSIIVKDLGLQPYEKVWRNMQAFTERRNADTQDEIWIVQHPPVFTLGLNGKKEHILNARKIPVIHCDRGGQVTYHAPGQLIVYVLLELKRYQLGVKKLVQLLEQSIIDLLAKYAIHAERKPNAPGVYVNGKKIAALGLRIRKGCSYHGLSLNVEMDLTPFSYINPCGIEALDVIQLGDFVDAIDFSTLQNFLSNIIIKQLQQAANPNVA